MYAHALDHCAEYIEARANAREAFDEKYGARAGAFLAELHPLFLLYRRLPFNFALPLKLRHLAGTAALYIAEHQDFVDDNKGDGVGLIDDVYVAFASLLPIVEGAGDVDFTQQWRGKTSFDDVVAMAQNLDLLLEVVPMKVRQNADKLLGLAET